MKLSEYIKLDGHDLAALCRSGEVSASEIFDCARSAIKSLNKRLNFLVDWTPAESARALDNLNDNMPFMGVPILLKDVGAGIAGVPQELGSRLAKGRRTGEDAEIVRRLRAAGLVIAARSTTPEFGASFTTESIATGITRNPWNPEKSTGGSSGGAAAAVAARVVPIAHAGDSAGSIRIPTHCCGLFGFKPSRGINPVGAHAGEINSGLTVSHVVTRSVRDSAAVLDATAGGDPGCRYATALPARSFADAALTKLPQSRIALCTTNPFGGPVSSVVKDATEKMAQICSEAGHIVEEVTPPLSPEEFISDMEIVWSANIYHAVEKLRGNATASDIERLVEPANHAVYLRGAQISAGELLGALDGMNLYSRRLAAFFSNHDILLTPTLSQVAPDLATFDTDREVANVTDYLFELFRFAPFTVQCNVSGQPAMNIPCGLSSDGLPVGVHFSAPYGEDSTLFGLAGALERMAPWRDLLPPINAGNLEGAAQ
ncbi:MAG: amidase [Robiginitomaculum sp.]|nr:MAG: amidase [Robiginitomaculum sp.]